MTILSVELIIALPSTLKVKPAASLRLRNARKIITIRTVITYGVKLLPKTDMKRNKGNRPGGAKLPQLNAFDTLTSQPK